MSEVSPTGSAAAPAWGPLSAIQRRVAAVLVEKAKTTPNAYPMTLNAIRTACNQTTNRDPVMQLEEEQVQEALDELREKGVVLEIHGGGRVPKYRHMMYEWLGINKVEMAVMVELLLRGAQTEGELRGRASRMEPINDLTTLRTILDDLKRRNLVIPLTPQGRGHVVTHGLYLPKELEQLRAQFAGGAYADDVSVAGSNHASSERDTDMPAPVAPPSTGTVTATRPQETAPPAAAAMEASLRQTIEDLQASQRDLQSQLHQLREELELLKADYEARLASLERFRDDLAG